MEEPAEGGSAFGPVDAAPPLSSSDWVLVPRELVLQVASVFVDFRDYADTCFRRLIDILGLTLYCRGTRNLLATAFLYGSCYCRCMDLKFF